MVNLIIDMVEEPVDEDDREFLYINHLNISQPIGPRSIIKGNYGFRSFGLTNDYKRVMEGLHLEESKFIRLANS